MQSNLAMGLAYQERVPYIFLASPACQLYFVLMSDEHFGEFVPSVICEHLVTLLHNCILW